MEVVPAISYHGFLASSSAFSVIRFDYKAFYLELWWHFLETWSPCQFHPNPCWSCPIMLLPCCRNDCSSPTPGHLVSPWRTFYPYHQAFFLRQFSLGHHCFCMLDASGLLCDRSCSDQLSSRSRFTPLVFHPCPWSMNSRRFGTHKILSCWLHVVFCVRLRSPSCDWMDLWPNHDQRNLLRIPPFLQRSAWLGAFIGRDLWSCWKCPSLDLCWFLVHSSFLLLW